MGFGKNNKSKTKTKPAAKRDSGKKVIRVISQDKQASKDERKRRNAERLSRAVKKIGEKSKMNTENIAKKAELEERLKTQSKAEQEDTKMALDTLDQQINTVNDQLREAEVRSPGLAIQ
jgi:hypothetical protein